MIPFYCLCIIPCFPFLVRIRLKGRRLPATDAQSSITVFFVLLFLLLALRSPSVGRDLENYRAMFYSFSSLPFDRVLSVHTECGYVLLNKLVALFTDNFQWLIAVTALITVLPIAIVYRDETEMSLLTISLFLTMSTFIVLFSGLRQSVAIALGMLAFHYTKKRRPLLFILAVLFAMCFHRSAFVLLAMYPVYRMKISRHSLLFILPALLAVFAFRRGIFAFLLLIISDVYESSISQTGAYAMLILFALFTAFAFIIPDPEKLDGNTEGLRNLLLLSLALQMFAPLHSLAMRFNYYYIILIPLLIPKLITRSSERFKKLAGLAAAVMTVFFFVYFFYSAPKTNSLDVFPYSFFREASL